MIRSFFKKIALSFKKFALGIKRFFLWFPKTAKRFWAMRRLTKIMISSVAVLLVAFIVFSAVDDAFYRAGLMKPVDLTVDVIDMETGFGHNSADPAGFSAVNHAGKGYEKVAETAELELYVSQQAALASTAENTSIAYDERDERFSKTDLEKIDIAVYDKRADKLWTSLLPEDKINVGKDETAVSNWQSLCKFSYVDYNTNNALEQNTNPLRNNASMSYEVIENGVRVTFDMRRLRIKFSMDFKIFGSNFDVTIPDELIEENLQNYGKISPVKEELYGIVDKIRVEVNKIKGFRGRGLESRDRDTLDGYLRKIDSRLKELHDNIRTIVRRNQLDDFKDDIDRLAALTAGVDRYYEPVQNIYSLIEEFSEKRRSMNSDTMNGIVTIDVLPNFGAADTNTDGYAFIPDGAGAISYFNKFHPEYAGFFRKNVYYNHTINMAIFDYSSYNELPEYDYPTSIRLPVYGVKIKDAAFAAIIAEGDTDAIIDYHPAPTKDVFSTINGAFILRAKTNIKNASGGTQVVYDNGRIAQPRRLRFAMLAGDDANYSGMAVAYRSHLEKYGLIARSGLMDNENVPLTMEFFMGMSEQTSGLTSEFKKLTSFSDLEAIFRDLNDNGVNNIVASSWNWYESERWQSPVYDLKPEPALGGIPALRSLTDFVNKKGFILSLEANYVEGYDKYMKLADRQIGVVKNYGNMPLEIGGNYLYSATAIYNRATADYKKLKDFGVKSATNWEEAEFMAKDYNELSPTDRAQWVKVMRDMFQKSREILGYASAGSAAATYFADVDMLYSVYSKSNEYLFMDEDVPFFQMIIHGSLLYAGEEFNGMPNEKMDYLRRVEYGYVPYYIVTKEPPYLKYAAYMRNLIAPEYSQWREHIINSYKDYTENLSDVWNVKINKHARISDTLVAVEYENGKTVVINYADQAANYNGTKIEAKSYGVI